MSKHRNLTSINSKDLNPVIAKLSDNQSIVLYGDATWLIELSRPSAEATELEDEITILIKNLDAIVALISDVNETLVHRDRVGRRKLPVSCA